MSSSPVPARLVRLSDLISHLPGDKVRFLGRVVAYSVETGYLYLVDPCTARKDSESAIVGLDTSLICESLRKQDTAAGTWLNIMGYVQKVLESDAKTRKTKPYRSDMAVEDRLKWSLGLLDSEPYRIRVQAVQLWESGPVDPRAYLEALQAKDRFQSSLC